MMQIGKTLRRTGKTRRSLKLGHALFVVAVLGATSQAASATPVTYTLTGTFSGSLGATSFTDAAGTFSLTGDTSYVETPDNAFFYNTAGLSTFQLGSSAAVTVLSSTFGVESEYGAATFMDAANNFAVGEYNELTPYDVLSAAGSTSGMFVSYGPNPQATSGGDLIITGATGDVTFQTEISGVTPVPEPASLWLISTGVLGAASGLARKRCTPSPSPSSSRTSPKDSK